MKLTAIFSEKMAHFEAKNGCHTPNAFFFLQRFSELFFHLSNLFSISIQINRINLMYEFSIFIWCLHQSTWFFLSLVAACREISIFQSFCSPRYHYINWNSKTVQKQTMTNSIGCMAPTQKSLNKVIYHITFELAH